MSLQPRPEPKARVVKCPTCGGPSVYGPQNRYRPFCSERCRGIDLGGWASESFRMPESSPGEDDAGPETAGPNRAS